MNTKIIGVTFLLTATALADMSAESAVATAALSGCERPSAADLHLHLINEAGAAAATLAAGELEAGRIWETARLHLDWTSLPGIDLNDRDTLVVVLRSALRRSPDGGPAEPVSQSHPPLGWLVFGEDGRPGNLIEVSFEALTSVVMSGEHMGKPVRELPKITQTRLLGCGLGRVVAHEIGHWLMGRGHTKAGLMRASFDAHDVLDPQLARLPDEWTAVQWGCCHDVARKRAEIHPESAPLLLPSEIGTRSISAVACKVDSLQQRQTWLGEMYGPFGTTETEAADAARRCVNAADQ